MVFIDQANCDGDLQNIALMKAATQSSEFGWPDNPAIKAVDGSHDGYDCSHTETGEPQWWMVDLGDNYYVCRVTLWNRQDKLRKRLCIAIAYFLFDNSMASSSDYYEWFEEVDILTYICCLHVHMS